MRMPTRKIRPAAHTKTIVAASAATAATIGCHTGTPGGIVNRMIITVGADSGKNDIATATTPEGFCSTGPSTNIGKATSNITGMMKLCTSLIFEQAAPAAAKSEPYMNVPTIVKKKNQAIDCPET